LEVWAGLPGSSATGKKAQRLNIARTIVRFNCSSGEWARLSDAESLL
jgi:hypothetical protein